MPCNRMEGVKDSRDDKNLCFFCWRRYPYESALRDHLRTHVCDSDDRPCHCYECNPQNCVKIVEAIYLRKKKSPLDIDRTSTEYLRRLHGCRLKTNDKPVYLCDQCGGAFRDLVVFVKHLQVSQVISFGVVAGVISSLVSFYASFFKIKNALKILPNCSTLTNGVNHSTNIFL